jgi:hypothetical protein
MDLPVGKPTGSGGFVSRHCWKAFIWLLISVCNLCIKDRPSRQGAYGADAKTSFEPPQAFLHG